jgi:hypothetical protein
VEASTFSRRASALGRLELRGWRRAVLPPVAAFAAANLVLVLAAAYGGYGPFAPASWARWDSGIYLDIARHGYQAWTCPAWETAQGATACGTMGWFPLYPALVAPLHAAGAEIQAAGMIVSLVFWLATLVVLWNAFLVRARPRNGLLALGLAAVTPGAFFFHTVYPLSLAAFLIVLCLWFLRDERWAAAGAAGFLAAAAYPTCIVLAPVAVVWLLAVKPAPTLGERVRRCALVGGLIVAGLAAVLLYAQLAVGQWDGWFGVQARFHHGVHVPIGPWLDIARPRDEGLGGISVFMAFQEWLTTALVAAVLVLAWVRRRQAGAFDWLLVLFVLAFWIAPLLQRNMAYYRADALLIPLSVALVRLPSALIAGFAVAGAGVMAGMALCFMQGILV